MLLQERRDVPAEAHGRVVGREGGAGRRRRIRVVARRNGIELSGMGWPRLSFEGRERQGAGSLAPGWVGDLPPSLTLRAWRNEASAVPAMPKMMTRSEWLIR